MTRLTWLLWGLVLAAVAGAAVLFFVYFGGDDAADQGLPAGSDAAATASFDTPDLLRPVRPDATAADFVGTWSGETIDKPGEGTSTDVLILEIREPEAGSWTVKIEGTFAERREIGGLAVEGGMLVFQVPARDGDMIVRLGVDTEDDSVLIGEASPAPGNDWGDARYILLEREG